MTDTRQQTAEGLYMQTRVLPIDQGDLTMLRYFALKALEPDRLNWRHNGQGMLQAYMYEGSGVEARIHVWHSDLLAPGISRNGLQHDHRFDMRSHVILGSILHREYRLKRWPDIKWKHGVTLLEVTNARKAKAEPGAENYHMDPRKLDGVFTTDSKDFPIAEKTYLFPKFRYHRAVALDVPTVSIVLKSNQEDVNARLMDNHTAGPLINSFENPLSYHDFHHILVEARVKLQEKITG